jgi:predicted nucleic acid-binding protein
LSLVLDCSAALAFLLPDETASHDLLDRIVNGGAFVPSLWRLEVANALSIAVRRKRISRELRNALLENLGRLNIRIDTETDNVAWKATLDFADKFGLTLYDAAYLELSLRRNLPLTTLDKQLREAAFKAGIVVLDI